MNIFVKENTSNNVCFNDKGTYSECFGVEDIHYFGDRDESYYSVNYSHQVKQV
jgi:hypothetical protein